LQTLTDESKKKKKKKKNRILTLEGKFRCIDACFNIFFVICCTLATRYNGVTDICKEAGKPGFFYGWECTYPNSAPKQTIIQRLQAYVYLFVFFAGDEKFKRKDMTRLSCFNFNIILFIKKKKLTYLN